MEKRFIKVTQAALGVLAGLTFLPTYPCYRTAAANIEDDYPKGKKE